MNKTPRVATFNEQVAHAMAEFRTIMSAGESPTRGGRLTARTIEIVEPSIYDARQVKKVRAALNVSQAVLARLIGVSDVLVRSWERGARQPAPIARRLLDQIRAYPAQFAKLMRPAAHTGIVLSKRSHIQPRAIGRKRGHGKAA